jgi:NAD(P)-dependent dehydrogenase (short-subunit alcohol dehydrogenase family)
MADPLATEASPVGVLTGKSVIVTGAGRGLGRSFAIDAAREGADVVVNDVDSAEAGRVVEEIQALGRSAVLSAGSVADWESAAATVKACVKAFGRVDGLVNSAGVFFPKPPWEASEAEARTTVEVNLLGCVFMGTHAIRQMRRQQAGSIVNITSSAQMGIAGMGVYCATKGALASLTYSWALDLAGCGIRVNAFAPSARTRMSADSPAQLRSPGENAPVVTYLLSDLAERVRGQVVQFHRGELALVAHPRLSGHRASGTHWSARTVAERLGPLLATHAEPCGWELEQS